jgi:hypothetical protein
MPAGSTYTPIATTTLGSNQANYTFSSIPSTYTDLIVVCRAGAVSNSDLTFRVNGDTGTNYSSTFLYADGTGVGSTRTTSVAFGYFTYLGSIETFGHSVHVAHFMNYSNTTTFKTVLARSANASRGVDAVSNLWRNSAAINSITLIGSNANLLSGSTFTLYGIAAA